MTNEQKPSLTCKHDLLARSCPHCEVDELDRENQELKARLARYDDARLIDEAGLREMGVFTESFNNREGWKFNCKFGGGRILVEVNFNGHATTYLVSEGFSFGLYEIRTFGQLHHILDALGIGGGDGGDSAGTGGE